MAEDLSGPGWIAFWSLLGIIVSLGLLFYITKYTSQNGITAEPFTDLFGGLFGGLLRIVLNIIPIGLFSFGIVADIVKTELRASIPTIGTFITLILIRLISSIKSPSNFPLFDSQSESNSANFWCSLPGLEFLENPFFPSSILSTAIIGFYYIWWSLGTSKQTLILSYMSFAISSTLIQFKLGSCENLYYPIIPLYNGVGVILQTLLLGLGISGFLYGLIWGVYRNLDPLQGLNVLGSSTPTTSPGKYSCPGQNPPDKNGNCCPVGTMPDSTGNCTSPSPNTTCPVGQKFFEADSVGPAGCRCPNGSLPINGGCPYSSNQSGVAQEGEQTFVAELYKNGQLVTDSLSN